MIEEQKKLLRRRNIGINLMTAGAVIIICVLLFWIFGSELVDTYFKFEDEQQGISDTSSDSDGIPNQDTISIPGFAQAAIPPAQLTIPFKIYNPSDNPCYFEAVLYIEDGKKEIYRSNLIKPGKEIGKITLSESLAAGTYTAVLHYNTYSMDGNYTPMNGADVPFTLIVSEKSGS